MDQRSYGSTTKSLTITMLNHDDSKSDCYCGDAITYILSLAGGKLHGLVIEEKACEGDPNNEKIHNKVQPLNIFCNATSSIKHVTIKIPENRSCNRYA